MDIEIKIVDSYRMVDKNYWQRIGKFYAENVWKLPIKEAAERIKVCFTSFEAEYAVKWFEIAAYKDKEMVGFMRLLRNPDIDTHWFICDVHTAVRYRKQGIATRMLESAIETVKEFESAEYIISSISASNKASIALHKKLGFVDTGVYPEFTNFEFEEDETEYELRLLQEYPAKDTDVHRRILYKLMRSFLNSQLKNNQSIFKFDEVDYLPKCASKLVKKMLAKKEKHETTIFNIIWCGNNSVGFKFKDDKNTVEYRQ